MYRSSSLLPASVVQQHALVICTRYMLLSRGVAFERVYSEMRTTPESNAPIADSAGTGWQILAVGEKVIQYAVGF